MIKNLLAVSLFASSTTFAEEFPPNVPIVPSELYMKLDSSVGGYLTLTLEPCEIQKVKNPYEFKAKIETNYGTRRACWNTHEVPPEMQGKILPFVHVVEEEILEDGTRLYNIGTIARYYFKTEK